MGPARPAPREDIDGSRAGVGSRSADHRRVAPEGDRGTKPCVEGIALRDELGLLRPGLPVAHVDIRPSGRPGDEGVLAHGHRVAGLEGGLLCPARPAAREDVHGSVRDSRRFPPEAHRIGGIVGAERERGLLGPALLIMHEDLEVVFGLGAGGFQEADVPFDHSPPVVPQTHVEHPVFGASEQLGRRPFAVAAHQRGGRAGPRAGREGIAPQRDSARAFVVSVPHARLQRRQQRAVVFHHQRDDSPVHLGPGGERTPGRIHGGEPAVLRAHAPAAIAQHHGIPAVLDRLRDQAIERHLQAERSCALGRPVDPVAMLEPERAGVVPLGDPVMQQPERGPLGMGCLQPRLPRRAVATDAGGAQPHLEGILGRDDHHTLALEPHARVPRASHQHATLAVEIVAGRRHLLRPPRGWHDRHTRRGRCPEWPGGGYGPRPGSKLWT